MTKKVNYEEINGFTIDEFNIYGLQVGATYSICPKCSPTRRNKKQKCMMLDWDRGKGTCNHCGEVIQLHTFKKKAPPSPIYATKVIREGYLLNYHENGSTSITRA